MNHLTKENKPISSWTHRDSTQPVACIRGYEPSGASYRVIRRLICRLIQAPFQAQRQLWYSPTCDRYKDSVIVSFHDVKCKQDYIWRKIDTITESLAKTAKRAKQNTVQDGLSSNFASNVILFTFDGMKWYYYSVFITIAGRGVSQLSLCLKCSLDKSTESSDSVLSCS